MIRLINSTGLPFHARRVKKYVYIVKAMSVVLSSASRDGNVLAAGVTGRNLADHKSKFTPR
jgi:hypothetical protein